MNELRLWDVVTLPRIEAQSRLFRVVSPVPGIAPSMSAGPHFFLSKEHVNKVQIFHFFT